MRVCWSAINFSSEASKIYVEKKNACICEPGNRVTILEFPNLKDNS